MAWIDAGSRWSSKTTPAPDDWNAALQLARAGLLQ
jgi:hypothetical protein